MGCPWSRVKPKPNPQTNPSFSSLDENPPAAGGNERNSEPPPPIPPRRPISHRETLTRISAPPTPANSSRVDLYRAIYVAKTSHRQTDDPDDIAFEKDDEFKLITEYNIDTLCLQHLRTGRTGIVQKQLVRLDPNSPLRLGISERGLINRCLAKDNKPGAFLIRPSRHDAMEYVLSINQVNYHRHCDQWHYLIRLDDETRQFYFRDEEKLRHLRFSSFHSLINHQTVRKYIPLEEVLPHYIDFEDEVWNIPLEQLQIESKIGEGAFGEVFSAAWRRDNTSTRVAVKKIRVHGITDAVTREIEAMKILTNLYIVQLYGVSKDPQANKIFLVTEYMENGDLKSWLTKLPSFPDHERIFRFATQISIGMSYLEDCNYVHRDLACRNILVGPNAHIVKIADFGLSIFVNDRGAERLQKAAESRLAFRWLAPELFDNRAAFSNKSDVWSYGIVLIEIWLKGANPYDNNGIHYVQSAVMNRYVHPKPDECPEDFYQSIICQCLRFEANDRPTFKNLNRLLNRWLDE